GGKKFNLRSFGGNFSIKELKEAVDYTHDKNKKVYITLNSIIFEKEIAEFTEYIKDISKIDFDGYIISDPGLIAIIKKYIGNAKIHMSTQLSTTNHLAVNHYKNLGVKRVNIAREIRYNDLKELIKNSEIEIEVFIHGSLCISYSGRCMLSKYMAGRDANKGECAHSCRWKYHLMEEQRPNLFYNITQESDGTYIYNSRDLCLLPKLDQIVDSGVSALKIEGRMKTESYVAQAVWVYRKALDLISEGKFDEKMKEFLMQEINKCSHRDYTLGFMFLDSFEELENNENVKIIQDFKFIGTCHKEFSDNGDCEILVKNQFKKGDIIEILEPGILPRQFKVDEIKIKRNNYEFLTEEANPNDIVLLKGSGRMNLFSIIRKKSEHEKMY
ncbi:MAG: U32 family peptidase, partial [Actinomycetota bacterium]|nr:U32 family peptidase [Actinomycetota bacterium]